MILDDRYRVVSELGRGGFGVVYRGIQINTGQTVAIKVLHLNKRSTDSNGQAGIERFRREMQVISKLKHPNIVRLIDTGSLPDGELYTVLEFIEGQSLAHFVQTQGALPLRDARTLMLQVLDALCCAHALGVVHRDLKPHNIMITETGGRRNAMVLDFGIAGVVKEARGEDYKNLTEEGGLCGTPSYMAPEQIKNRQITPQSDIYAWGLVFLECICGQTVIDGESLGAVIFKQMSPDPIAIPVALLSHPLGKILARATAKDLGQRYATAQEVLRPLEDCIITNLEGASFDLPGASNMGNTGLEYKTPAALSLDQTLDSHLLPFADKPTPPAARRPWAIIALSGVALLATVIAIGFSMRDSSSPVEASTSPTTTPPPAADAVSAVVPDVVSAPPTVEAVTTPPTPPPTQPPEPPPAPVRPTLSLASVPARSVQIGAADAAKYLKSMKIDLNGNDSFLFEISLLPHETWAQPALEVMTNEASWALWQGYQDKLSSLESICPDSSLPSPLSGKPEDAIVAVSPAEADAFCALFDMRLPTAREVEAIGRGPKNDSFPFGSSLSADQAKALGQPPGADPLPWNKTEDGIYNLAGGVFEWVSCDVEHSFCKDGFGFRGGSWQKNNRVLLLNGTLTEPKDLGIDGDSLRCARHHQVGFRCVKSVSK
jgi:serine/threonine protein kinase